MKYLKVDPENQKTEIIEVKDSGDSSYCEACQIAGLNPSELDFGTLDENLSIIVFEWGLMNPKVKSWFSINHRLFNGPAIIFASNYEGATISIKESQIPKILWLNSIEEVEAAIASGKVVRPQSSINGQVFWEWNRDA